MGPIRDRDLVSAAEDTGGRHELHVPGANGIWLRESATQVRRPLHLVKRRDQPISS